MKIVFIGSSHTGLEFLLNSNEFSVSDVLCLEKRITPELIRIARNATLEVTKFSWIVDFKELVLKYKVGTVFFIYQLDMLVPSSLTGKYDFFNIHRGNLFTNRGPNPDIWPILLGEKVSTISLHKINDKIDSGILIDSFDVDINEGDNPKSVKNKMEKGIPNLLISLKQFILKEKSGIELVGGDYRPWITEQDITINLEKDSIDLIKRKILCQYGYNGAIIVQNSELIYVNDILIKEPQESNFIKVTKNGNEYYLVINTSPKYPRLPVFPKAKRI